MVDQDAMRSFRTKGDPRESRREHDSKLVKVKKMLTDSFSRKSRTPCNFEEAKMMSKARKRKERQESTSSLSQERKVIRSSSEERPTSDKAEEKTEIMRRVLSQEDVQKSLPLQEKNETNLVVRDHKGSFRTSPQRYVNMDILDYDDCERRRTYERFALPLAPRGRRINISRKKKSKHFPKIHSHHTLTKHDIYKENNNNNNNNNNDLKPKDCELEGKESHENASFLQLFQDDKERSNSPVHTPTSPALDLTTLHQQIDCSDPLPSISTQQITEEIETLPSLSIATNRMLSSPRNSIMITHRIYLDPNVVPQTKNLIEIEPQSPLEKKLKHLSKQIGSIKKKMRVCEEEFQVKFGFKPSQADRNNDKTMRKLCGELLRLKKDYRQLKDDPGTTNKKIEENDTSCKKKEQTLRETIAEIDKKLSEKRTVSNRGIVIEDMNNEQVMEEKVAVQKALLYLESIHGRPSSKDDRDLVRPLYDRYRTLKRMVAKISMPSSSIIELATIHEYETMDFVSAPSASLEGEEEPEKLNPSVSTDSDTDISLGETFHNLTLDELVKQQKDTNEEKKKLKRSLKEFENEFQTKTGRKLQKDDKIPMAGVYTSYKQAKAKLRLLDALVGKQVL